MEIVNGTEITYLYAQGQPFALHKKNSETEAINYLHLDYQGSIMAITDQNGTLLEERNGVYPERSRRNVWGRPRTANTLAYVLPNPFGNGSAVKRGYTFHEHLEEFNLINMNGRVYDPVLARFLNADPLLQDNTDGQNYNRYSYVLNNPTKYTDPSGYAISGIGAGDINKLASSSSSSLSTSTSIGMNESGAMDEILRGLINDSSPLILGGFNSGKGSRINPLELKDVVINKVIKSGMPVNSSNWSTSNAEQIRAIIGDGGNARVNLAQGNEGWYNSKLALDIVGGIYGMLQTAIKPGDQWLGNNGKYYNNSWGGNQYTGGRSEAFKVASNYKWAGRTVLGVSVLIGGVEIINGYQIDGGKFGYNAQSAAFGTTGSLIGGYYGSIEGATAGLAFGVMFGPPGMIIGPIVGGFIGGFGGSYVGGKIGSGSVNLYHGR